jgi:5-methyltetrahydrofolate--homocysteine methyltransferase
MFKDYLSKNIVLLDGAMGTALQNLGLKAGEIPELLNLTKPEMIYSVHKSYIDSGSRVIYSNTFGANRKKMPEGSLKNIIETALKIARKAAGKENFVALDIGPIGELIEPMGSLTFEEAYDIYKEVIEIGKDFVDLIVIETMTSLYELKAALLAAKENSNLPIICTMSFEENMRTFTGCSPSTFALTATPFADAIGINCSLGPNQILPIMKELSKWTSLPLVIKANAGMPDRYGNYSIDETEFATSYEEYLKIGVTVVGGCCGTTPDYIKKLNETINKYSYKSREKQNFFAVCSQTKTVEITGAQIIGERINPTGKKLMKQALYDNNFDYLKEQAVEQTEAGADILDVNVGLPEIDETKVMIKAVKEIQAITDCPLQIDSKNVEALENGLRVYCGKAIVNSVSGEVEVLESILPLVKKYGAAVVGLTMDENGIPNSAKKRVEIAEKILKYAKKYGIDEKDVYIDCLTLTVSAEQQQAKETLEAIKIIKKDLGLKTLLGVSNISFGLPERQNITTAFLIMAMQAGLDLAIINPNIRANTDAINSFKVLNGTDIGCKNYIASFSQKQTSTMDTNDIFYSIVNGLPKTGELTNELLKTVQPLEIVNYYLMPSLDKVGIMFEKGEIFLPQLISAAESAKLGFEEIKKSLKSDSSDNKGKIILATVKGDIHDIGKNIVKILLENYGYKVIDLGKNVDKEIICETAIKENIQLVGLSALMTTTAVNMKETIEEMKKRKINSKIMVGGAVLTEEYAKSIGADFYAKDANQSVKYAKEIFGK